MRKKILLVDDDQDILHTLGMILTEEGYRVRQATGWHELFKWLNSECIPDLILLDLMIPEFDGFELLSSLKGKCSRYRNIPVVVVSGVGNAVREHVLACGATDYLAKPFAMEQLLTAIERWTPTTPPVVVAPPASDCDDG